MTFSTAGNIFGRTLRDELATFITGARTEVDQPVGGFDYVQVMLDNQDGMTDINQALKDFQQQTHIVKVKAGCGLVEKKEEGFGASNNRLLRGRGGERGRGRSSLGLLWRGKGGRGRFQDLRHVTHELQPLAFAAGKSIERLTEFEITEADLLKQPETGDCPLCRARFRERGQKLNGLIDGCLQ